MRYINLDNTYDQTRYGFNYGYSKEGYFEIYLDGKTDAETESLVSDFIINKIPKSKAESGYDFFAHFGDKTLDYDLNNSKWPEF